MFETKKNRCKPVYPQKQSLKKDWLQDRYPNQVRSLQTPAAHRGCLRQNSEQQIPWEPSGWHCWNNKIYHKIQW